MNLHALTEAIYLLAAVLATLGLALPQPRLSRLAVLVLAGGALVHAAAFFQAHEYRIPPRVSGLPGAVSLAAWLGTLFFLVLVRRPRLRGLVVIVAPAAFLGVFFASRGLLPPAEASAAPIWAQAHVLLASAGFALLGVAGGAGALFLVQRRSLKRKQGGPRRRALPPLEALDRVNALAISVGFLLLSLALVTGMLWTRRARGPPVAALAPRERRPRRLGHLRGAGRERAGWRARARPARRSRRWRASRSWWLAVRRASGCCREPAAARHEPPHGAPRAARALRDRGRGAGALEARRPRRDLRGGAALDLQSRRGGGRARRAWRSRAAPAALLLRARPRAAARRPRSGVALSDSLYELSGPEAVRHVFRVASSIDSMVIGEPQILGQVKDAYRAAIAAGACGCDADAAVPARLRDGEAGADRDAHRRAPGLGGAGRRRACRRRSSRA